MDTVMFVSYKTYYADLKVIDERLSRLEHIIDMITKQKVEELNKGGNE